MSSRCLLLIGRVELPHECRQQDLGHRSDTQTYHEALYVRVCPVGTIPGPADRSMCQGQKCRGRSSIQR